MSDPTPLFIDTSYVLGLYNVRDQYHRICVDAVQYTTNGNINLYTTDSVLMEIGNAFSSVQRREQASEIIREFLNSPNIEVIYMSSQYFRKALKLFEERKDKEWGMVDCYSFVVMKKYKLKAALTTDHHFRQAGYKILPF